MASCQQQPADLPSAAIAEIARSLQKDGAFSALFSADKHTRLVCSEHLHSLKLELGPGREHAVLAAATTTFDGVTEVGSFVVKAQCACMKQGSSQRIDHSRLQGGLEHILLLAGLTSDGVAQ